MISHVMWLFSYFLFLLDPFIGPELYAGLVMQKKMENYCPRLYLFSSCREHEEEEPDSFQHGGG